MITGQPVTKEALIELLIERNLYGAVPGQLDVDTSILLDSLSLVWFVEGVERRFGIALELEDADYGKFGSVNEIYALLCEKGVATNSALSNP